MKKRLNKKVRKNESKCNMDEAPVGGQEPAAGSVNRSQMGDVSPADMLSLIQSGAMKPSAEVVAKIFAPLLIPKDPNMKRQIKQTFDLLNKAQGKDAATGSFLGMLQNMFNTPQWLSASRKRGGKVVGEAKELVKVAALRNKINEYFAANPKQKSVIIKSTLSEGQKTHYLIEKKGRDIMVTEVNTVKNRFIIEQDDATPISKLPQEDEPEDKDSSLDQEPSEEPRDGEKEEEEPIMGQDSPEMQVFKQSLEGKPIDNVSLETKPDGMTLALQTADSDIPSELSFHRDGKVVYTHKNRPHVLKKA